MFQILTHALMILATHTHTHTATPIVMASDRSDSSGSENEEETFLETSARYLRRLEEEQKLKKRLEELKREIREMESENPRLRGVRGLGKDSKPGGAL